MTKLSAISTSLEVTLKDSDLQGVTTDLIEVISDAFLNEGILKEIPILGTIVGLGKATSNIKEELFLKKLLSFLKELKDIPVEKRSELITKIDESKDYTIKVGEKLIYIIEKCEDYEKSQIIGLLFKAFLLEKINYDCFLRASIILDKVMSSDLKYFLKHSFEKLVIEEADEYINCGLFKIAPISIKVKEIDRQRPQGFDNTPKFKVEGDEMVAIITSIGKTIRLILK